VCTTPYGASSRGFSHAHQSPILFHADSRSTKFEHLIFARLGQPDVSVFPIGGRKKVGRGLRTRPTHAAASNAAARRASAATMEDAVKLPRRSETKPAKIGPMI